MYVRKNIGHLRTCVNYISILTYTHIHATHTRAHTRTHTRTCNTHTMYVHVVCSQTKQNIVYVRLLASEDESP